MTQTVRRSGTTQRKPEAASAPAQTTTPSAAADPAHDFIAPDAPVQHLVRHARAIAALLRMHAPKLVLVKLSVADADRLDALAASLDEAEHAWLQCYDTKSVGSVARVRAPLRQGRDDLYDALRTFATDPATHHALDDIAGVDTDDDLAQDTVRLLALAKRHHAELDGTEFHAAFLDALRGSLRAFAAARSVTRSAGREVDGAFLTARAARNRAYWALATLDRTVVQRARLGLRREPDHAAQFTSYLSTSRRRRKAAGPPPAPPAPPATH